MLDVPRKAMEDAAVKLLHDSFAKKGEPHLWSLWALAILVLVDWDGHLPRRAGVEKVIMKLRRSNIARHNAEFSLSLIEMPLLDIATHTLEALRQQRGCSFD